MKYAFLILLVVVTLDVFGQSSRKQQQPLPKNIDYCQLLKTAFNDTAVVNWFKLNKKDSIVFINVSQIKINCGYIEIRKSVRIPILDSIPVCCKEKPDSCLHYYRFFLNREDDEVFIGVIKGVYRGGGKTFRGAFIYQKNRWHFKKIGLGYT